MRNIPFIEGLEVLYKELPGTISFVCEDYITVCVARFDSKVRDVCVVIYPERFCDIHLYKESTK